MLQNRIEALATRIANYLRDSVLTRLLPSGGSVGQALVKTSGADFASSWQALGGGGSATGVVVEVDSSTPYVSKFFQASLPGAIIGQKVICSPSLEMPAGVAEDELEDDPICVSGRVVAADLVRLLVASVNGSPIGGKRNINVVLA